MLGSCSELHRLPFLLTDTGLKQKGHCSLTSFSTVIQYLHSVCLLCYAKSLQSCLTLCDPIDSSPPGFPVPGILQARTLEWVAISFSKAWKWKVKGKSLSHVQLLVTPLTAAYQAPQSPGFSRQEHWSGLPFPSPMHESEKWKWSRSVVSNPQRPHGLQPSRLLHPWDFPGKSTGVGAIAFSVIQYNP